MNNQPQWIRANRILALKDRAFVRSPFSGALITKPDYTPKPVASRRPDEVLIPRQSPRWKQLFHQGNVYAVPNRHMLHAFYDAALRLNQPEHLFVVSGKLYNPQSRSYLDKEELFGSRFTATKAFVSSEVQKNALSKAFKGWGSLEILVVADLYERICEKHDLEEPKGNQ